MLAFNTETRDLDERAIRDRLMSLASRSHSRIVFKKIDSLMRGNPAFEIATSIEAWNCDEAIVTPAFPAMGRRVVDGRLIVDTIPGWQPLDISAIARNAASDEDLRQLVRDGLASHRRILWAGSGGLAGALAEELLGPPHPATPSPAIEGRVVFCIGSDHPVTLAQQALLIENGHTVVLPDGVPDAFGAILMTGGDTAALVCRAIGAQAIELEGEILTGLPWGRIVGGRFHGKPIATKSGAFGAPDALLRVAAFFATVGMSPC